MFTKGNRFLIYLTSIGNSFGMSLTMTYASLYFVALGATPVIQSILVSVRNLGSNVLQLFWGTLSDRYGRKKFLLFGFFSSALTTLLFILIHSPLILILVVGIQALIGSMVIPSWNGLLGDFTKREFRGRFIGFITSIGTLFSIVGLILIGFVSEKISGSLRQYYFIFAISALFYLLAAISSYKIKAPVIKDASEKKLLSSIVFKDLRFRKFIVINSIFLGTMALAWPLFPYVTVKVVNATKFQISLIWASFMVTSFIGQKYGGMLSDVIGRRKSLFIFFLPMSLVAFFYAIAQNWYYLLLGSLFGGLSNGAGFIAANTYVLDCAPETKKASYTGFSNLTIGVASFISSLISGVIAQNLSGAIGLEKTLRVMLFIIFLLRILSATFYLRVEETLDLS